MMTEQETKAIDQSRQGVAITDLAAQARAAHENYLAQLDTLISEAMERWPDAVQH